MQTRQDGREAQRPQLRDVRRRDALGVGAIRHRPRHVGLPQQMKRRDGRPVGEVRHILGGRVAEQIVRMKGRDLQHAFEAQLCDQPVRQAEAIEVVIELDEVGHQDQRGLKARILTAERAHLGREDRHEVSHFIFIYGYIAKLLGPHNAPREGAEAQADDHGVDPGSRSRLGRGHLFAHIAQGVMMSPDRIIEEWFGEGDDLTVMSNKASRWFKKDPAFDTYLRDTYGATVEQAIHGNLVGWADTAAGAMAEVILLDQFTRNIYRGTAKMYAGDDLALPAAKAALKRHAGDLRLIEQLFLWMPFEHAEELAEQEACVKGVRSLAKRAEGPMKAKFEDFVGYAIKHRDIVAEFGRFPHRNAILGRENTPEEEVYLAKPGAGF